MGTENEVDESEDEGGGEDVERDGDLGIGECVHRAMVVTFDREMSDRLTGDGRRMKSKRPSALMPKTLLNKVDGLPSVLINMNEPCLPMEGSHWTV